ncbi:MAG TPA: TolC family protein [Pseudolabrys sp.]|nr:TolC family protein [Pseudolabrys sp.]
MRRCLTMLRGIAVISCASLAACQTFSQDGGMSVTADIAGKILNKDIVAIRSEEDVAAARVEVERLLKRPLTADAAVQIALLNNRGLQASYNELGIAEAVRVQQSLPPNPHFSVTRMTGAVETEIERQIVASILALATLPMRSEIAADRFHQAQLAAALETLRVAAEARRAFYRAVAAQETVRLFAQANDAAETMTQLAKRLGETGAMNKLDQAREQAFHSDVIVRLASAQQRASRERERLVRALGLWGNDLKFVLPKSLPTLPKRALTLPAVEQQAVRRRVDLQIARIELDTLAKAYGLTNATRFINVLDAGYADKITKDKETGETVRDRGFTVSFEVPLFDFGEARVREAEQTYMQAVNRLAQKAVNVRSEAREAYRNYRTSYDIASHYQREVLPLRKIISDEMMLRYGAMQVDVFTLLLEAQQKLNANAAAADALRDFWLASTDLATAMAGGGTDAQEPTGVTSAGRLGAAAH